MSWQTPKTNWQVEDVPGGEDFERIEGNIEYLKGIETGTVKAALSGYADGAHMSDFVLPSNTVILRTYAGGPGDGLRKIFRVKYPGIYRIQVNATLEGAAGLTGTITVEIIHTGQKYSVSGNTPGGSFGDTRDIFIPAGGQIYIYVSTGGASNRCWIDVCYVMGTLYTHTTAPSNAVLQDS